MRNLKFKFGKVKTDNIVVIKSEKIVTNIQRSGDDFFFSHQKHDFPFKPSEIPILQK